MSDESNCAYCGTELRYEGLYVWSDGSGGDCCSGDSDGRNENEPHTPWRAE